MAKNIRDLLTEMSPESRAEVMARAKEEIIKDMNMRVDIQAEFADPLLVALEIEDMINEGSPAEDESDKIAVQETPAIQREDSPKS